MIKLITALLLVAPLSSAFALPKLVHADKFFGKLNLVNASNDTDYNFEGIVGLNDCSGSLIRFKNDTDLNKKALIMTNGHCTGLGSADFYGSKMPAPGEVLTNLRAVRNVSLFHSTSTPVAYVKTTKLIYATMTETDMAIYELNKTYKEIKNKYDIDALILSEKRPSVGDAIEIISGYWKRGYACRMDSEIFSIKEGDWVWTHSIKYSKPGCETIGGTSGSPIISSLSREVVGINNTGNDDSDVACSVMNPCEIDEFGNIKDDDHSSYGQQTFHVYTCLNEKFEIDLSMESCLLPK